MSSKIFFTKYQSYSLLRVQKREWKPSIPSSLLVIAADPVAKMFPFRFVPVCTLLKADLTHQNVQVYVIDQLKGRAKFSLTLMTLSRFSRL